MAKIVDLFLTYRKTVKPQSMLRDSSKGLTLKYAFDLFIILPNTDGPPLYLDCNIAVKNVIV